MEVSVMLTAHLVTSEKPLYHEKHLRAILRESEAKLEMKNYNPPSFYVWR